MGKNTSLLKRFGGKAGLTLAELLIALGMVTLVAIPAGWALIQNVEFFDAVSQRYGLQQTAQTAMTGIRGVLLEAYRIAGVETGLTGDEGYMEVRRLVVAGLENTRGEIRVDETGALFINGEVIVKKVYLMMKPLEGGFQDCRGLMLKVVPYDGNSPGNSGKPPAYFLEDRVYFRNAE